MNLEGVEFRLVEPGDISELALVTEKAYAQRDNAPIPSVASAQTVEDVRVRMDRIKAHTHVAVHGKKIVGFALSHPLIDIDGGSTEETDTEHLALLMTDPDYWGRRIASNLLALTVQHARENGRRRLTLWTREADNARTRNMYAHRGFRLTDFRRANEEGAQVQYQLDL